MKPYCILFILSALVFFACSSTAEIKETSPKFNFPTDSVFTSQLDTLRIRGNFQTGFRMDSIAAGDTAWIRVDIDGVFHQLTEINFVLSDSSVAEILFPDQAYIDSMFLSPPNFAEGQVFVAGSRTRIPFQFAYRAIRTNRDVSYLTLTAHSTAGENHSVNNFRLILPIKRTPAPQFSLPTNTLVTEQNDSLRISLISGLYRLDPLTVGDAVEVSIEISGVRNNLKKLIVTPTNAEDAETEWNIDTSEVSIMPNSGESVVFEFTNSPRTLTLPFKISANAENRYFGITFEAHSDALFDYGVRRFEFRTPIIDNR